MNIIEILLGVSISIAGTIVAGLTIGFLLEFLFELVDKGPRERGIVLSISSVVLLVLITIYYINVGPVPIQ